MRLSKLLKVALSFLLIGLWVALLGACESDSPGGASSSGGISFDASVFEAAPPFDAGPAPCTDPSCQIAVANPVTVTVAYGSKDNPITLNITGGTAAYVSVAGGAAHGQASSSNPTSITYTPAAGYAGPDSFTYTATNGKGTSSPATVSITVNPEAPVANPVSLKVDRNSTANPVTLDITGGTPASVAVATPPAHGTATANGVAITYTPTASYLGSDSFTYTATNAGGTSLPATVSVTVSLLPPIANPVSAQVAPSSTNNPITLSLTGGVADSVTVASPASHGSAVANGVAITYTPAVGYVGLDSFTYTATNPAGTSTAALVSLAVGTPPPPPVANNVSRIVAFNSVNNNVPLNITGGTPTAVNVATAPTHGTATANGITVTYTPAAGYFGPDSFTYIALNGGGTSAPATVSITVTPQPPIANPVSTVVAYNSANNPITLNITGGAYTSVAVASAPGNGTASVNGLTIRYTPAASYSGPDSFTYTASNAGGTSAPATISITVNPNPPLAFGVTQTVAFQAVNVPIVLSVTGSYASVTATVPLHGTTSVAGTSLYYTPNPAYAGADTFNYTATNAGGTSAPAPVSITIPVPPPPIANPLTVAIPANSSNNTINLNLTGGPASSVALASAPQHGTASVNGLTIRYTPTAGYQGRDTFQYTATNPGGTSAPALLTTNIQ